MAAEYTENLGLKKPAQEDFYNVDDFNENADIIDAQITKLKESVNETFEEQMTELKKSVSDGKTLVANAITEKGVATETDASFATMATNVKSIVTMEEGTKEATAAASDILSGKIAYGANGVKLTGTIASQAAQTITPGTSNKTIAAGKYLSGVQTIKGDSNLKAANIKKGVSIFGVAGSCEEKSAVLKSETFDYTYWLNAGSSMWGFTGTSCVSDPSSWGELTITDGGGNYTMTGIGGYGNYIFLFPPHIAKSLIYRITVTAFSEYTYAISKYEYSYYKDCQLTFPFSSEYSDAYKFPYTANKSGSKCIYLTRLTSSKSGDATGLAYTATTQYNGTYYNNETGYPGENFNALILSMVSSACATRSVLNSITFEYF